MKRPEQRLQRWWWQQHRKARVRRARIDLLTDALQLLDFNGIDGDYVEFDAFVLLLPLAHRINRRLPMERHLWAVDHFQGIPAPSSFRDLHPRWQEGRKATSEEDFIRHACRRCRNATAFPNQAYTTLAGSFSNGTTGGPGTLPSNIALAYENCYLHSQVEQVRRPWNHA